MSPVDCVAASGNFCAEILELGPHADSAKVQSIGVPACLNRDVFVRNLVRVVTARDVKQLKFGIGQFKVLAAQRLRVLGTAVAVTNVGTFLEPLRVVQKRKQLDHRSVGSAFVGEAHSVLVNAAPVRQAVQSHPAHDLIVEDSRDERLPAEHHSFSCSNPRRFHSVETNACTDPFGWSLNDSRINRAW